MIPVGSGPTPAFGEARKHGNQLRLIEHAMTTGLPGKAADGGQFVEDPDLLRRVRAAVDRYNLPDAEKY
jgi:hypothetical protein